MRKSFRSILSLLIILTSVIHAFAQVRVEYKDVILDGEPANLNMSTGEITLVKSEYNDVKSKSDSVKTKPIRVTDTAIINASNVKAIKEDDNISDFHIVKEGENLFKISQKYNTSLGELKKANTLETTVIRKGQKLRVRNFDKANNNDNSDVWTVSKGDTLYSISKKNGTTIDAIKRLNGLTRNLILVGQKLQLK